MNHLYMSDTVFGGGEMRVSPSLFSRKWNFREQRPPLETSLPFLSLLLSFFSLPLFGSRGNNRNKTLSNLYAIWVVSLPS